MSRRNKLGNKAKRGSRSSSSSNVSSATTSEDDADEVTDNNRVETDNVAVSSNRKNQEKDLDVEDDIVSCYSAMVSKGAKVSQSKDLDCIPDDVVFDFDPLCSDKEDANEYIDDIMPADIQDPDISIDAHHISTKGRELGSRKISAVLSPGHKLLQNDISINFNKVSYV